VPKIRSILKHVVVERAAGKRKCHRDAKHAIAAGTDSLAIYDDLGGRKNYCSKCAEPILDQADSDLKSFRSTLGL
jgi:hypothetical protein